MTKHWTFRTRQFEIEYERGPNLSYALLFRRPHLRDDWPLEAATDFRNKRTRQALVRELIQRYANSQVAEVEAFLRRLGRAAGLQGDPR